MNIHNGMKSYAKFLWIILPLLIFLVPVKFVLNSYIDIQPEIEFLIIFLLTIFIAIFAVKRYNK